MAKGFPIETESSVTALHRIIRMITRIDRLESSELFYVAFQKIGQAGKKLSTFAAGAFKPPYGLVRLHVCSLGALDREIRIYLLCGLDCDVHILGGTKSDRSDLLAGGYRARQRQWNRTEYIRVTHLD